jgi:hypothetical protein
MLAKAYLWPYRGFLLGTGSGLAFPLLPVLGPGVVRSISKRTSGGLRSLPITARKNSLMFGTFCAWTPLYSLRSSPDWVAANVTRWSG